MNESDMEHIAEAIDIVLNAPDDEDAISRAKAIALQLCTANPLPYAAAQA